MCQETLELQSPRGRVGISGTTAPTSKVHGEGKKTGQNSILTLVVYVTTLLSCIVFSTSPSQSRSLVDGVGSTEKTTL